MTYRNFGLLANFAKWNAFADLKTLYSKHLDNKTLRNFALKLTVSLKTNTL